MAVATLAESVNRQPRLRFAASPYLAVPATSRVETKFDSEIAERTYPPNLADLKRDWVSSVAAPAFAILARQRSLELSCKRGLTTACRKASGLG